MIDQPTAGIGRKLQVQLWLAAIYIVIVGAWSCGIVFHGAPDESTHFFLLEYLNHFHALPSKIEPIQAFRGDISGHTWVPGDFWYSGLPFPHVLGALVTSKLGSVFLAPEHMYLAVRSFNWFMAGIFITAIFRTATAIGLRTRLAALVALTISLIPQVTFVFSYFNSDAYGLAVIALAISALTSYLQSPAKKQALWLGVTVGLLIMAKLYFLPALVFIGVMLLVHRLYERTVETGHICLVILWAVVLAAPLLAITYFKYGEVLGISGQLDFVAKHKSNSTTSMGVCYIRCANGLINWSDLSPWLSLSSKSYFSVTGWMNIYIAKIHYAIAATVMAVIFFASLICMVSPGKMQRKAHLIRFVLPVVMILGLYPSILIFSILASQNSIPQPQGRYLFVTIPFLGLLISLLIDKMLGHTNYGERSNGKAERLIFALLVAHVAWLCIANFSAWRANTVYPDNLQGSVIGKSLLNLTSTVQPNADAIDIHMNEAEFFNRISVSNDDLILRTQMQKEAIQGSVDEIKKSGNTFLIRGWSFPPELYGRPEYLIVRDGNRSIQRIRLDVKRPDVAAALGNERAADTGFSGAVHVAPESDACTLQFYTLTSSLNLFPMGSMCDMQAYPHHD